MSLFRRSSVPSQPELATHQGELAPDNGVDNSDLLPIQFVESHSADLAASAKHWDHAFESLSGLKSDGITEQIRAGVDKYAEAHGDTLPENQCRFFAQSFTDTLANLCFITSRASNEGGVMRGTLNATRLMFEGLPKDVFYVATREDGPKKTYIESAASMRGDIKSADAVAQGILGDAVSVFGQAPAGITALAELYDNGAAEVSLTYNELQQIIRTDWYSPDKTTSHLRQLVERLGQDPDAFLGEFIDTVLSAEQDKKLVSARNMARFALAASSTPETADSLKVVLFGTRPSWVEFEDINEQYLAFQKARLGEVQVAFDRIAGPAGENNPRMLRTLPDIAAYKRGITVGMDENRDQRRKRDAVIGKRAVSGVPKIEISNPTEERYSRDGKPIYHTKAISKRSLRAEQIEEDEINEFVASKVDDHLVEDILACIKKINEDPMGHSSRFLSSGQSTVTIDGKSVRLRRFKPRDAASLNISREAESYRICYGLIKDGSVVITDILNHNKFTQKYT